MNTLAIVTGILLLSWYSPVGAKKFKDDCELVRALRQNGFPENQLADWACLINAESSRTTTATHKNNNGSKDYGLFQINSKYWCGQGQKGGDCNMRCEDLVNENITDDAQCARKIFKRHGFSAWYGWQSKCKGKALPNVSRC